MVKRILLTFILLTLMLGEQRLYEATATYYVLTGTTASGEQTRKGIIACAPEHLGQTAILYKRDGIKVGEILGIYECLDTGKGKNNAIIEGYVVDIWTTPDCIPPTEKVFVQYLDAKG